MIEDYKILMQTGTAVPTGQYETTRIGTKRAITVYKEIFKTPAGEFSKSEWYEKLHAAILEEGEMEQLQKIMDYCRNNCVWLHTEREIEEYSMDILAGRTYKHWKNFHEE